MATNIRVVSRYIRFQVCPLHERICWSALAGVYLAGADQMTTKARDDGRPAGLGRLPGTVSCPVLAVGRRSRSTPHVSGRLHGPGASVSPHHRPPTFSLTTLPES
jgi:hypothetical protein